MRNKTVLAATVLVSTLVAIPALAQSDDVCLRLYDVRSTRVHDNSTLVATDRQRNQYTVHMSGVCVGLNTNAQPVIFRPISEYTCLRQGDRVGYNLPGEPLTLRVRGEVNENFCFIDSIVEGAPSE